MARPANSEFLERLSGDIRAGRYDRMLFLPAERQLAEEFGVGRGVVRHALKTLQQEGLLRMIPQRGCCLVRDTPNGSPNTPKRMLVHFPHRIARDAKETLEVLSGICQSASEQFAEVLMSFASPSPEELNERVRNGDLQGVIYIEKGSHEITFTSEQAQAAFDCFTFRAPQKLPAYSEYASSVKTDIHLFFSSSVYAYIILFLLEEIEPWLFK